jgi:hypothetical protein
VTEKPTLPRLPDETACDVNAPQEATKINDDDTAIDTLGSPLGQIAYENDPPPITTVTPPPLPAPKKWFRRSR